MDNNIPQNNPPGNNPLVEKPSLWLTNPHLKMLLLALVFVFLGCGIFLVALMQVQNQYRRQPMTDWPRHQIKSASSTSDQASAVDWKTYKNDQYGFEFSYPPDAWAMDNLKNFQINSGGQTLVVSLYNINSFNASAKCQCGEVQRFQIRAYPDMENFTAEDNARSYDSYDVRKYPTQIGGLDAYISGEMSSYIFTVRDGTVFMISSIQEIISTFKFTK